MFKPEGKKAFGCMINLLCFSGVVYDQKLAVYMAGRLV